MQDDVEKREYYLLDNILKKFIEQNKLKGEEFRYHHGENRQYWISNQSRLLYFFDGEEPHFAKISKRKRTPKDNWGSVNGSIENITKISKKLFKKDAVKAPAIVKHPEFKRETYRVMMREVFLKYNGSSYWKNVVNSVRERHKYVCADCNKEFTHGVCHHTSYDNWGKGNYEEISDCVWLCKRCHVKRHIRYQDDKTPFWAKRDFHSYISNEKEMLAMFDYNF